MKEDALALAEEVESTIGGCYGCLLDKRGLCKAESDFDCNDEVCKFVAHRLRAIAERDAEDVTTVSAYDLLPDEDREAIAWVREMGGVEAAKSRTMPEGCEWPRYESGEMLQWNDEYANGNGGVSPLHHVSLYADGRAMLGKGKVKVVLAPGERVKRPAPKVLDADGVEIKQGDTVWAVGDALTSMQVLEIKPSNDPDEPEHLVWCGETWGESLNYAKKWRIAGQLTHEQPDDWKRWREDLELSPVEYTDRYRVGRIGYEELDTYRDLVRRAKKLAERAA